MEEVLAVYSGGKKRPLQISLHYSVVDKSAVAIWVEQHIGKVMHKSNAKSMKSQSMLNFQPVSSTLSEKVSFELS